MSLGPILGVEITKERKREREIKKIRREGRKEGKGRQKGKGEKMLEIGNGALDLAIEKPSVILAKPSHWFSGMKIDWDLRK